MTSFTEYASFDGIGLAKLIADAQVAPSEVLEAAIERVERYNPSLNAVVHTMYEDARRTIDSGLPIGPLAGVPFLLKDLGLAYAGQPLSNGSRLYRDFVPAFDSTLTARYKAAGLIVLGKTNTPECGIAMTTEPVLHGPTRNPWHLERTPAGSSGGAAAAVAAAMVPLAHASDGGGSIRMPAANCGLFGLKPTRARTPSGPAAGEGWSGLGTYHCVSRSVRDSAVLLDLSHGADTGDPYAAPLPVRPFVDEVDRDPGRLRIALVRHAPNDLPVHPDCLAAVDDAAQLCQSLGHDVEEQRLDYDYAGMCRAMRAIIAGNLRHVLQLRWQQLAVEPGPDGLETVTWLWSEQGHELSAVEYAAAVAKIHEQGRWLADFFRGYDLTLSPVLAQPPAPFGVTDMMSDDLLAYQQTIDLMPFTPLYNVTGCPAMSVPLYWNVQGLPIGVQFGAPFGNEAGLFRLAGQLERARPWFERRPALADG